jgi:hypothetical protein
MSLNSNTENDNSTTTELNSQNKKQQGVEGVDIIKINRPDDKPDIVKLEVYKHQNSSTSNNSNPLLPNAQKEEEEEEEEDEKEKKKSIFTKIKESSLVDFKRRQILGRDSSSCFKLALCYFIFYLFVASLFSVCLYVFYNIVDKKKPTYYNEESVMNWKGVSPGIGYRPQIDLESKLISINITNDDSREEFKRSMDIFLRKYDESKENDFKGAQAVLQTFDYTSIIDGTPCSKQNK